MAYNPIPDALALDLKAYLIANSPAPILNLSEDNVRLKHAEAEPPSPRVVILTGDGRRIPGMDATARVMVSIEIIESMDRVEPDVHKARCALFSDWFRELKGRRNEEGLFTRTHLHDILIHHLASAIRVAEREQSSTLRGEFISSLLA